MTNPKILYLFLYRKIRKKANGRKYIANAHVLEVLRRSLLWIPRILHYPIIKELEEYNLLRRIDKRKYEITGRKIDVLLNKYNCPF